VENGRSQCRRLQDGHVVYVAEVLVVIKYNVRVARSGYTKSVVVKDSMYKVMKSFICRGCSNPVISSHTSVDTGASANQEVVNKFCYLDDVECGWRS